MRIVLGFIFVGLTLLFQGCGPKEADPVSKKTREAVLTAGTEVPLILLRPISAGSTREGTLVPFMVAKDVQAKDGSVAIEKGTIAEGEVTWSRSEGTLSGLMNQPARLTVRLRRTRAVGGETVELCADPGKPDEPYGFTRENTGLPETRGAPATGEILANPEVAQRVEAAIEQFFETGDASKLDLEAEANQWLHTLTRQSEMKALDESLAKGGSDLEKLVKHVRDGSITSLAAPDLALAVTAIQELGRVAHSIERGIAGRLKGRTIKAHPGTLVQAYVARETKVKVQG